MILIVEVIKIKVDDIELVNFLVIIVYEIYVWRIQKDDWKDIKVVVKVIEILIQKDMVVKNYLSIV